MSRRLRYRNAANTAWDEYGRLPQTAEPAPTPGTREPTVWPFPSDDIWNLPIADAATYEASTEPITANLISDDSGTTATHKGWYWNQNSNSHPVYFASSSDPMPSIADSGWSVRSVAAGLYHIGTGVVAAAGNDGHAHVIQPDGVTVVEMIRFSRQSDTAVTASRVAITNLVGSSLGPFDQRGIIGNGTRAWGGDALGGLIRKHECQAVADYMAGLTNDARGLIPHVLAIAIRPNQLFFRENTDGGGNYGWYTSGLTTEVDQPGWPAGTNRNGFMRSLGYRWPATEQDYNGKTSYSGLVPTGSLWAIPPDVDVAATFPDTTSVGRAQRVVAYALQDYGARVVDRADVVVGFCEAGGNTALREAMSNGVTGKYDAAPWRAVGQRMRRVLNDQSTTPAGAALGAARRVPLAPEL